MSSYANHQAFAGLALGRPVDYRDTYDTSLLQSVPRSLNRGPLDLEADNLPFHSADIQTLYKPSWLNVKGLPQVAVSHVEPNYTSANLIELKSFKLYLNSFNQTRFNNRDEVRQTLEHDLNTCAQGKTSVALCHLNGLGGRPIGHFNGTCIDDQDITIDNYELTTDHLENTACGKKVVEETLVNRLLESNCLIIHQPDRGSIQIQCHGRQIDKEKLLCYLISFCHHNEFHEQCVERIFNDLSRPYRPEKLSVYTCYTHHGSPDVNPWRSNNDFVPSATRLVR